MEQGTTASAPHIRVRQPAKSVVPAASRLQLPFAEQDDDFVEFAKSLTKLPAGKPGCLRLDLSHKAKLSVLCCILLFPVRVCSVSAAGMP